MATIEKALEIAAQAHSGQVDRQGQPYILHSLRVMMGVEGQWRAVVRTMKSSSRPGTFTADDFERYRTAWSKPQAFRSMIHWYRAALRKPPKEPQDLRIQVPTLVIWGGTR